MKRLLIVVGAVLGVVIIGVVALLAVTFMGRQTIVDGQEVNGARIVEGGCGSVAVIPINERQVALIDAGEDQAGEAIKRELMRRQLSSDAVAVILLTHGPPDHTGAIKQFPQARVMALEAEVP